ncbi:hypothetical protein Pmani_012595 [Petrolisthes manimaculis]|uniref:U-box domain-containing protein n=1 Tax=Petrolisthes manimaculis TaxID=1843537 RepID=A0AAE1UA44_9EUCA|nr:hypothetical protein Pmani_012595 [Petrolisthes manimaculis]
MAKTLSTILKRDYSDDLDKIKTSANQEGIHILMFWSKEEEEEDNNQMTNCPERFFDSVTMSVMESPMLLNQSKVTVDESTLAYLLLQKSPQCPFTRTPLGQDSFCFLLDLLEDINAWRRSIKQGSSSHHNEKSEAVGEEA